MSEVQLTKEQQAVVENRGGTLLVSAAAGSGKTKVLIDRVLGRVEQEHCNVDDFLMITFTQAAAAELRGKLIARLSERLSQRPDDRHLQEQLRRVYLAQISTVHSFCSKLLQEYGHLLDLPTDFRLCDEQETMILEERALRFVLEEAYRSIKEEPELEAALNMFGRGRNDKKLPGLVQRIFRSLQCYRNPKLRFAELHEALHTEGFTDVGQTVWGRFLLDEFRASLSSCEDSLLRAIDKLAAVPPLAYCLPEFHDNLNAVRLLKAKTHWDDLVGKKFSVGRLMKPKTGEGLDVFYQAKKVRKRTMDTVGDWLDLFVVSSEEALGDLAGTADGIHGLLRLAERFGQQYQAEKEHRRVLDYNDLEHLTLRLLLGSGNTPTATAREISQRYVELMVDEYQDTNGIQDAIFRAISKGENNLFFVGDVKQAIYRFRLADPTIFLEKYKAFRPYTEVCDGEPRKILLSDNFRSDPAILSAANDVFSLCMTDRVGGLAYGPEEALCPKRDFSKRDYTPVELLCVDTKPLSVEPKPSREAVEAELIARRIEEMLSNGEQILDGDGLRPIEPSDIVILCRKMAGKTDAYVAALARHGIRLVCGNDNLFEREEIILLSSLLQILDNPHQDIPLLSALLSPIFCFSCDSLALARAACPNGDLYDALKKYEGAKATVELIEELRELAGNLSLHELLDTLESRLLLRPLFAAMEDGAQRIRNLERFFALADAYENGDRFGLAGFLNYLELLKEKGLPADVTQVAGAVRMMSIHKSKGLEFPVVFLADLCGKFSTQDEKQPVLLDTQLGIGARAVDVERCLTYPTIARQAIITRQKRENHSEEMRILYVAMTRAKCRMIMTCCASGLAKKLEKLADELTLPAEPALIEAAGGLSHWVLMAAMSRTEAGNLFAVSGTPEERRTSEYPWRIVWQDVEALFTQNHAGKKCEVMPMERLPEYLPLTHNHADAEKAPSKITATQLKGRSLDDEVAEHTAQPPKLHFPKPCFTPKAALSPSERGTAIHLAMQYVSYEKCSNLAAIGQELDRLVDEKYLSLQQRQAVSEKKLLAFFTSPLGRRVLSANRIVREFKFSVLEDGSLLQPSLAGEKLLLQGVTDCCILEDDGMTIIDFKSDYVQADGVEERASLYRGQMEAYSRALSKVFRLPVKECILYFFSTNQAVPVTEIKK